MSKQKNHSPEFKATRKVLAWRISSMLEADFCVEALNEAIHRFGPPEVMNTAQRRDLMEIVEDRYQAGSTIITSQLPVSTWHDVIGEPTFADAILDRLVHNTYRLELEGQSFRKKTPPKRVTKHARNDNQNLRP